MSGGGGLPDWKECEEELLSMIGVETGDYQILKLEWDGEPYDDENGEVCRDADAFGRKKVRDCVATYGGQVELPDIDGFHFQAVYEKWENPPKTQKKVREETVETLPEETQAVPQGEEKLNLWAVIKSYAVITIGIAAIILAAAGGRLAWLYLKKKKEKR